MVPQDDAQAGNELGVEVEYVNELDEKMLSGKHQVEFKHIFERFKSDAIPGVKDAAEGDSGPAGQNGEKKDKAEVDEQPKLSRKRQKELNRMKVSELKQVVKRPDVVESWDVTAKDPLFLVWMKTVRNSVPVPKHWCQKRKFLQYKRGLHKTPFKLPEYIEDTGIAKVRESSNDTNKSLKQRMKERMQPKTGKLDIDYQVLHDAFFKHQTKPRLSVHGDVYYEGKEYEVKMRVYKPGRISADLCHALGIPESSPPPWLINMQRFGPPPAYPSLKIPGVNAPIPDAMHYGQGKYVTDERGFTVYADCHGLNKILASDGQATSIYDQRKEQRVYWGQVKEESEEEEEASEEVEDKMEEDYERESVGEYVESDGGEELAPGMKSGITSIIKDVQIGGVDIRKKELQKKTEEYLNRDGAVDEEEEEVVRPLYRVLREVDAGVSEGQIMGTGHTYEYANEGGTERPPAAEEQPAPAEPEPKKPKKEKKEKIKYKF